MDDPAFRTVAQGTLITCDCNHRSRSGCIRNVEGPLLVSNLSWRQYEKRRSTRDAGPKSNPTEAPLSWSELRTYNLLDTGFSGALTAGFLNTWKRGRPGLVPGLCTGAFICTLLQWTYNELGIARVKFVSRNRHAQVAPASPTLQLPSSPPLTSDNRPTELPRPLSYKILGFLGFQRISDEEYLTKMKATRDHYLRQIEVLEREAEEKSREDLSESNGNS
ncbi:hypothetical protein PILCRDRAFT_555089 [Piloderma croceum F 1598]|uniref:Uncharacterized protein n=1 Tax=Piloderma croceum (strain F 1598) TaxID=765440 RepID=A0A0C3FJT0_PILCF|nr:hypothetical protein PILCRDRAFT_555089 [Piloderma croceum F 1598]